MKVILRGESPVSLQVLPPSVKQIELLQEIAKRLEHPEEHQEEIYLFAAMLLSQNREGIKLTPEDLREKHDMQADDMIMLFDAYADFINEFSQAKN